MQPETSQSAHPCYYLPASRRTAMKLLLLISNAFINTMGITQPSPQTARRAAWFIVALLSLVVAAIVTVALLAFHLTSHP